MAESLLRSFAADTLEFPELDAEDSSQLIEAIQRGLPAARFDALQAALGVPAGELAGVLSLSPSTLSRRRQRGFFDRDESERLVRIGALLVRAVGVLETLENARKWLTEPVRALGGEVPLRYASVEPGAREVECLLGRLEHGVFS